MHRSCVLLLLAIPALASAQSAAAPDRTSRVAWLQANGVTRLVELGAGKVLTGLAKRIAPDVAAEAVGTADEVHALAAELQR